ncbi:MAG: MFS transporter [Terriglobia bacterium]
MSFRRSRLAFLRTASQSERNALAASFGVRVFAGMDDHIYTMLIPVISSNMHLSNREAGLMTSTLIVSMAVGGVIFGLIADRMGRKPALVLCTAYTSLATAGCALAANGPQLAGFLALTGLGTGGEWALATSFVAETWRSEHRAKALGLVQSGFSVGYGLAAVARAAILPLLGWQGVFAVAAVPSVFSLWILRNTTESPEWLDMKAKKSVAPGARPPLRQSVGAFDSKRDIRANPAVERSFSWIFVVALFMNTAAMFAWWSLFTWLPTYLVLPVAKGGRDIGIGASTYWILIMQMGMMLGEATFGFFGDAFGVKKVYLGYLVASAVLVHVYVSAPNRMLLMLAALVLGFFAEGQFSGFAIMTARAFPIRVRGLALGLTWNLGRALSAPAPWVVGMLAGRHGLGSAFWVSSLAFIVTAGLGLAYPSRMLERMAKDAGD